MRRLASFHGSLLERLTADAPDLLPRARREVPGPRASGYQVLPGLLPEKPPPRSPPRASVAAYSWPWTRTMIDRERAQLEPLETDLARAPSLSPAEKRALYERLLTAYAPLSTSHLLIDSHIRYNRLWQESIASNREIYDRETRLEKAVLDRQAVQDELSRAGPGSPDAAQGALRAREEALAREIHDATDAIAPLPFLRVEHPSAHRWIVRVPFVTDIEDRRFLAAFRKAVEEIWHVVDGGDDYRVAVSFDRLAPARLYAKAGTSPPRFGDPIDLARHLALFPEGAAVLTTGANAMHVTAARCIVLGPSDIAPHDLAHEVGHILGFRDVYFRGYRSLGEDGFEVQEVIADPGDIMGAPGSGPVRKEQFARLIDALRARQSR